ncbi:MAG: HEAT repeat domain-containing protein [Capsulimonadales bacterium]|nr:HEAT repeat domain-containing protein [Capsulimonadales bacterium]
MIPLTPAEKQRRKYRRTANRAPGREERLASEEVAEYLSLTFDPDPALRCDAVRALCPCHVQANRTDVWDRLLQLSNDPDLDVRKAVFHTLGDGSPAERETEIVRILEAMYQEPDPKFRRQIRHLLAHYRRTGRLNIL